MSNSVKKRETFYLAGYDPRGARHYYNLYKKEAALQSEINGMEMDISSRKRTSEHMQTWQIESQTDEGMTHTNYHFLEWDDIIRTDWKKDFFSFFKDFLFYFKTYILAGRFIKYSRVSPRQMVGIFFPIVYILLSIVLGLYLGNSLYDKIGGLLGIASGIVVLYIIIHLLFTLGNRLALFWLLRIFVFSGRYVFEEMQDLEIRLEVLSAHLAKVMENADKNNVDEVLFVAHSVGAIITIPLLEKTLKKLDNTSNVKLSVLILGECIPLVSGIDKAVEYKKKMAYLAESTSLCWLDFTSVIDGACFPTLNYFKDANIEIKKEKNFHFLSARFHTLFSKQRYAKLRKNRYLAHFLYLMATDFEGNYDYFKMTAGSKRLCSYIDTRNKQ